VIPLENFMWIIESGIWLHLEMWKGEKRD